MVQKFAVMVSGPATTIYEGLFVPVRSPDQLVKLYPGLAVAEIETQDTSGDELTVVKDHTGPELESPQPFLATTFQ